MIPAALPRPCCSLLACACAFSLGLGCDDGGGGLGQIDTPQIETSPEGFFFPKLNVGDNLTLEVQVSNVGGGPLILKNPHLVDLPNNRFELRFKDAPGDELAGPPARVELPGGDEDGITFAVRYTAVDASDFAGLLRFDTNDPERPSVSLVVTSGEQGAEIRINPQRVEFGQVAAGDVGAEQLTVSNVGQSDLIISRIDLNGSQDFSAYFDGQQLAGQLDDPLVVRAGEPIVIEVRYEPPSQGPDSAQLVFGSNDGRNPERAIDLSANGAAPCIQVTPPDVIDFASSIVVDDPEGETPNVEPFDIASCGNVPLQVSAVRIEDDNGVFRLVEAFEPFDLPAATPGEPPPNRSIELGFWPLDTVAYGGRMIVESNTDDVVIDLFGRGLDNACPVPITTETEYNVHPLDIITLDGSPSSDAGGEVERWVYTVINRPDGSVSLPAEQLDLSDPTLIEEADDEGTPLAQFFVDLAGEYTIELKVYDDLGQESCPPKAVETITVRAVPSKDLHLQLVWSTPDDPDETDATGTDIDLHLRHQDGASMGWGADAGDYDCYFRNKTPDWGSPGDPADNPTLDIDDTNGAGPENINLASPEPGVRYDVGALYFRATSSFGSAEVDPRQEHLSLVTIRLFVRGDVLAEWVDRELLRERELLWVTSINWCADVAMCPTLTDRDQVYQEGAYPVDP